MRVGVLIRRKTYGRAFGLLSMVLGAVSVACSGPMDQPSVSTRAEALSAGLTVVDGDDQLAYVTEAFLYELRVGLVDGNGDPLMPCGRCRQLLYEHGGPDLLIMTPEGVKTMAQILPQAFGPWDLEERKSDK